MQNSNRPTTRRILYKPSLHRRKIYLARREADLSALQNAINNKDFKFILDLSHKLIGSSALFEFSHLGVIASRMESATLALNFDQLRKELFHLETAIHDYLLECSLLNESS